MCRWINVNIKREPLASIHLIITYYVSLSSLSSLHSCTKLHEGVAVNDGAKITKNQLKSFLLKVIFNRYIEDTDFINKVAL